MLPRPGAAAVLVCAALAAHAQSDDRNVQNLLAALVNGAEATLVTPLITGEVQLTSFQSASRMSAVDAMAAINRARAQLQALGEPQPTAEEIARMLAGGPIDLPSGRIHAPGSPPASGRPSAIHSQVVAAGTAPPAGAAPASAAGGSAPAPA